LGTSYNARLWGFLAARQTYLKQEDVATLIIGEGKDSRLGGDGAEQSGFQQITSARVQLKP
jgi:hypothetical protein